MYPQVTWLTRTTYLSSLVRIWVYGSHYYIHLPEQMVGWFSLGLGLVVDDVNEVMCTKIEHHRCMSQQIYTMITASGNISCLFAPSSNQDNTSHSITSSAKQIHVRFHVKSLHIIPLIL